MPISTEGRKKSRLSVAVNSRLDGGSRSRATLRRTSVHELMASGNVTKNVKRKFYGLADELSPLSKFWHDYSHVLISISTVIFYYLFGFIYYYNAEPWDMIEVLYFQTATLTTVGYGDYSPNTFGSRTFTVFYIFIGVLIVGRILNAFGHMVLDYAESTAKKKLKSKDLADYHSYSHYMRKAAGSMVLVLIVLLMGATFYSLNENWDFSLAFYFCVVTTSTVGYGDTALTKDSSRVFAIFYMLSSVLIVTLSVGQMATVFLEMKTDEKRLQLMSRKLDFNFIRELDDGEREGIDKLDFLIAMLVNLDLVDKERDVTPWLTMFERLDKQGVGVIDFNDAIADLEEEQRSRIMDVERQLKAVHEHEDLVGNLFTTRSSHTARPKKDFNVEEARLDEASLEEGGEIEVTEIDTYPIQEIDKDEGDASHDAYFRNPLHH